LAAVRLLISMQNGWSAELSKVSYLTIERASWK
jgi:hypothetical protein